MEELSLSALVQWFEYQEGIETKYAVLRNLVKVLLDTIQVYFLA